MAMRRRSAENLINTAAILLIYGCQVANVGRQLREAHPESSICVCRRLCCEITEKPLSRSARQNVVKSSSLTSIRLWLCFTCADNLSALQIGFYVYHEDLTKDL